MSLFCFNVFIFLSFTVCSEMLFSAIIDDWNHLKVNVLKRALNIKYRDLSNSTINTASIEPINNEKFMFLEIPCLICKRPIYCVSKIHNVMLGHFLIINLIKILVFNFFCLIFSVSSCVKQTFY